MMIPVGTLIRLVQVPDSSMEFKIDVCFVGKVGIIVPDNYSTKNYQDNDDSTVVYLFEPVLGKHIWLTGSKSIEILS